MSRNPSIIHIVVFVALIVILLSSCDFKHNRGCNENIGIRQTMTREMELEKVLKEFIQKEEKNIRKDAPFIYESDVFEGGVLHVSADRILIGKWAVDVSDTNATATLEKNFNDGERIESEVLNVNLSIHEGGIAVTEWKVYHRSRKIISR